MTTMPGTNRRFDVRRAAIGSVTILALLTIGALWQRAHPYSIETSTTIDASPGEVWAVLSDFESYDAWNPTLDSDFGDTSVDSDPPRSLHWETHAGVVGIFDGERSITLEELDDGGTLLTQTGLFRGVAVLFMTGTLRDDTAPSFHAMNAALRERVESETSAG